MGLGLVVIFALMIGGAAALLCGAVLVGVMAWLTHGAVGRNRYLVGAAILPFVSLVWVVTVFIGGACAFPAIAGKEMVVFGDFHVAPLGSGYEIVFFDPLGSADFRTLPKSDVYDPPEIAQALRAQIAGPYIFADVAAGRAKTGELRHQFVVADMASHRQQTLENYPALENAARERQVELRLEPVAQVYAEHRLLWINWLFWLIVIAPPALAFAVLVRGAYRLRRRVS